MVNTTMAITKTAYQKLLKVKHDMEEQRQKTVTFSEVIEYLINNKRNGIG